MSYTITSIYNMSVRTGHSTYDQRIDTMLAGERATGDEIYTVTADGLQCKAGDQWLHVLSIGSQAVNGWIAIKHLGRVYCTLVELRQYYRLRYDWEKDSEYGGTFRPATPCPGVLPLQQKQFNAMSDDWAQFWFSLNTTGDIAQSKKAWNAYTNSKAFLTNGAGTDICRNVVTGTNMDKPLPKIMSLVCCGNVVCAVGEPMLMWKGMWWIQIETLDITKPPPVGITYLTHPHLIHHAVNLTSRFDGKNGFVVNPFAHLGGRATGRPVFFPVTSKGAVYYPAKYLQKLPPGSPIPNPYNPPMI